MRHFIGLAFLTVLIANEAHGEIAVYTGIDGAYSTVTVICSTPYSAEAVWSLVGDWGNESLGEEFVEHVEITGREVGSLRTSHLRGRLGSGVLVERLEAYDAERRSYSYTLADSNQLPWAGYQGKMSVNKAGANSLIFFEARMVPFGVSHAEAASLSVQNMRVVCSKLDKLLGTKE